MRIFRKLRKKLVIVAIFCGILLANIPADTVYASNTMTYGSWVQDTNQYDSVYGTSSSTSSRVELGEQNNDETVGFGEFFISSLIEGLGWSVDQILNGDENFKADIDTIIRGRVKRGISVNWYSFELVDNNPFGIIGATMYKVGRNAFFPLMVILWMIVATGMLINSDKVKGLLDIKQAIIWTLFMVLWLYMCPMITDFFLYAKDAYIKYLGEGLLNGEVLDIVSVFYTYHTSHYTIVSALLYDGAAAGGLFYLGNYIATAMTQTVLFGLMPLVCALSIKFKKIFSNVVATFIPNLLISAVDFSFLLMPILYGKLVDTVISGVGTPMVAQFVQLLMIWAIIPCRQAVFRAFGVMLGAGNAGGGFGGMLGTMAMMARSMSMGGRKSPSNGGNHGNAPTAAEDRNSQRYHEQLNETLKNDPRYNNGISENNSAAQEKLEQMTSSPETNTQNFETGMSLGSDSDNSAEFEQGGSSTSSEGIDSDFNAPLQTEHAGFREEGETLIDSGMSDTIQSEPMNMHEGAADQVDTLAGAGGKIGEQSTTIEPDNETAYRANVGEAQNTDMPLPTREENLTSLQTAQSEYDSASTTYQREQASLNDARSQLQRNEWELKSINSAESITPEQKARVTQLHADNKRLSENIGTHETSMNNARMKMADASGRLHESQRIEKSYADFDRMSGGTGKTYNNVGDFQLDNSLKEAQKRFINHRNFDSKQFDGVLSNEEKAKYYKQRARVTDAQSRVSAVGMAAQYAITATAVAGSTFGGANAMVQSGMLGYTAGGFVTDRAVQTVNNTIDNVRVEVIESSTNSNSATGGKNTSGVLASDNVEASKNASYYRGQVLANEKDASLKLQEEAIRRGEAKTNGS